MVSQIHNTPRSLYGIVNNTKFNFDYQKYIQCDFLTDYIYYMYIRNNFSDDFSIPAATVYTKIIITVYSFVLI